MVWEYKDKERLQRVLKEAILKEFKSHLPFPCEIDGIVCISRPGAMTQSDQIIIIIHNSLMNKPVVFNQRSLLNDSSTTKTLKSYLTSSYDSSNMTIEDSNCQEEIDTLEIKLEKVEEDFHPNGEYASFSCNLCTEEFSSPHLLQDHIFTDHYPNSCEEAKPVASDFKNFVNKQRVEGSNFSTNRRKQLRPKKGILHENKKEENPEDSEDSKHWALYDSSEIKNKREDKFEFEEDFPKCPLCFEKFSSVNSLDEHCFSEHRKYICTLCLMTFAQKISRDRHVYQLHQGDKPFPCGECEASFTRKDALRKHQLKTKHGSFCNPVSYSNYIQNSDSFNMSLFKTQPSGIDLTQIPSSSFPELPILNISKQSNEDEEEKLRENFSSSPLSLFQKQFKCDKCDFMADNSLAYKDHCKLVHRRTPCLHCGKTFSQKGNMERHRRQHTGERPFSCPHCSSSYTRRETLKSHMIQTHGVKLISNGTQSSLRNSSYSPEFKFFPSGSSVPLIVDINNNSQNFDNNYASKKKYNHNYSSISSINFENNIKNIDNKIEYLNNDNENIDKDMNIYDNKKTSNIFVNNICKKNILEKTFEFQEHSRDQVRLDFPCSKSSFDHQVNLMDNGGSEDAKHLVDEEFLAISNNQS